MAFIKGSGGLYKPIWVMFDTPIYERLLRTCWFTGSYKSNIALMAELLRLQQNNQLHTAVTTEDMSELLLEKSRTTLREQLFEFQLEDFDEDDVRPLLKLAWQVNNSMKMRDVEFEARQLLNSSHSIPPMFQHNKILGQAKMYARTLMERQQQPPSSKTLSPREVALEVVPKVLQGFWLPPEDTYLNMPSEQLNRMAVGATKAVEDRLLSSTPSSQFLRVPFSRSTRDTMVLSIQETVRHGYTQDLLAEKISGFDADLLETITVAAEKEIGAQFLLAPFATTPAEDSELGLERDTEPDSAVTAPPPSPPAHTPDDTLIRSVLNIVLDDCPPPPPQTPTGESPASFGSEGAAEQSMPHLEPISAEESFPSPSVISPAEPAPVQRAEVLYVVPVPHRTPAVISVQPAHSARPRVTSEMQNGNKTENGSGIQALFSFCENALHREV